MPPEINSPSLTHTLVLPEFPCHQRPKYSLEINSSTYAIKKHILVIRYGRHLLALRVVHDLSLASNDGHHLVGLHVFYMVEGLVQ